MRIEHRGYDSLRRFGVEMELDPCLNREDISEILSAYERVHGRRKAVFIEDSHNGWGESKKNDYWHIKYDSSCGPTGDKKEGGGWEVASYIACGWEHLDSIATAAECLKVGGGAVNDHCGLHVHAEAEDFSVPRMGILLANWVKIEPMLFQACPQRRRRNRHCKPLRKKLNPYIKHLPRDFYYAMAPVYLGVHENNDKRHTLNIVGFARAVIMNDFSRPTVEMRLPEGSLEPNDLIGWVTLLLNFVDLCAAKTTLPDNLNPATLKETFSILGLGGDERRFVILDGWLHETKVWFLKRLVEHATHPGLRNEATKTLDFINAF